MGKIKPEHVRESASQEWKAKYIPTGKTDPVFPYGRILHMRDNVYSIFEKSFDGHGDPYMHLIIGPQRALLIDTGFGIGDLKTLVEKLCGDKPVLVANTHSHIDHCYGNCQFERVYAHKNCVSVLRGQNERMWDVLIDETTGKGRWIDFSRDEIVPFKPYEIISCEDGMTFDLGGGYEVEMVFMPGHDPGHVCFLDKTDRILYGGDALLYVAGMGSTSKDFSKIPGGEYCTVEAFRNALAKLLPRMNEFDCIFMSHMVLGEGSELVRDFFNASDAVVKDPNCNQFVHTDRHSGKVNKVRVCGKAAVEYCDDRVYMETILRKKSERASLASFR